MKIMQVIGATLALALVLGVASYSDGLKQVARHYASDKDIPPSSLFEDRQNEVETRIRLSEPYKSLVQSTTRFALAQTKLSNHVNLDAAMELLNELAYELSKPENMFIASKFLGFLLLGIPLARFLVQDAQFVDTGSASSLSQFMLDFSEKSVLAGMIPNDFLNNLGVNSITCRQKTVCYTGDMIRRRFPEVSSSFNRYASDLLHPSYRDNRYLSAFLIGLSGESCAQIGLNDPASSNCFFDILNRFLPLSCGSGRTKRGFYQTLQANKSEKA